jgi:hypothetical protein
MDRDEGAWMRMSVFAGVVALGLFVAYFAPIVLKLKELPLAVVVIGGVALGVLDFWESHQERGG